MAANMVSTLLYFDAKLSMARRLARIHQSEQTSESQYGFPLSAMITKTAVTSISPVLRESLSLVCFLQLVSDRTSLNRKISRGAVAYGSKLMLRLSLAVWSCNV